MAKRIWRLAPLVLAAALAACGGGEEGEVCSTADQKVWLADYMDDWYFWYRLSPRPDPAGFSSVADYFDALLYTGSSASFPADRWSGFESTESFNRFFGDGQTLGYGVSVAGLEVTGQPNAPLYVRMVEPRSPAAAQGVQRGDRVISINGRSAFDVISADDFSALSATATGQQLTLVLRRDGFDRTVTLTAGIFDLTPVPQNTVVQSPDGRLMGYIVVKDMISQALAPMESAFASFRAQGVTEIVLDLRYNGGGLVSTGGTLASYVAGTRGNGRAYAQLLYNDKQQSQNQRFAFSSLANAAGVARVYVLTGERTCSASEQVVNGLRGVGVDVVTIGDTTCGKPVGFLPESYCGTTYSVVNFESVNDRFEGRYFDGFAATCAVAEDFTVAQGSTSDPLLVAAAHFADNGACPAQANGRPTVQSAKRLVHRKPEAGERQGMLAR